MTDPHAEARHEKNLRILKLIREDHGWALSRILLAEELEAREERLREALDFYAAKSDEWMNKEARQALHDVYGARREAS